MAEYTGGSVEAEHLCVLVHGLWGNPNHMANIAKSLREQYPADKLYILVAKRNSGSFTYDGIELGGERVCLEIEEELQAIESKGGKIKKLSVVGYSLGGLVARYAIGLLYAKGVLDNLECMSFTAFASPFLGVRTPLRGWANGVWNVLGARTLSKSGRQLFAIDKFRDTGRPLIAVLADPNSIFMSGLAKFKRRTLYSNIVNDRSAVYYTTFITKTDPYTDLSKVKTNFVKGYEDVILDPNNPVSPLPQVETQPLIERLRSWISSIPFILAVTLFLPIATVGFLITSVVETVRSSKRIQLHEKRLAGINTEAYRVPLLINEIRGAVEDAYGNLNSSQHQEYIGLSDSSDASDGGGDESATAAAAAAAAATAVLKDEDEEAALEAASADDSATESADILRLERRQSHPEQPTLALTPHQFAMIQALDGLGWRKYPVWIHLHRHSHAAIIVRMNKAAFSEGKIVLRHWLKEEFLP